MKSIKISYASVIVLLCPIVSTLTWDWKCEMGGMIQDLKKRGDLCRAEGTNTCVEVSDADMCRDNTNTGGRRGGCITSARWKGLCKDWRALNSCYIQNHLKCVNPETGGCVDMLSTQCRESNEGNIDELGACKELNSEQNICRGVDGGCLSVGQGVCLTDMDANTCDVVVQNTCVGESNQCLYIDRNACLEGTQCIPTPSHHFALTTLSIQGQPKCTNQDNPSICLLNNQTGIELTAGNLCKESTIGSCKYPLSELICIESTGGCHEMVQGRECKMGEKEVNTPTERLKCMKVDDGNICLNRSNPYTCHKTKSTVCKYTDQTCRLHTTDSDICLIDKQSSSCRTRIVKEWQILDEYICVLKVNTDYCHFHDNKCIIVPANSCRNDSGDCVIMENSYCKNLTGNRCQPIPSVDYGRNIYGICTHTGGNSMKCYDPLVHSWRLPHDTEWILNNIDQPDDKYCVEKSNTETEVEGEERIVGCRVDESKYCQKISNSQCRNSLSCISIAIREPSQCSNSSRYWQCDNEMRRIRTSITSTLCTHFEDKMICKLAETYRPLKLLENFNYCIYSATKYKCIDLEITMCRGNEYTYNNIYCENLDIYDDKCRDPPQNHCRSIEASFTHCKNPDGLCMEIANTNPQLCLLEGRHSHNQLCHIKREVECLYKGYCYNTIENSGFCISDAINGLCLPFDPYKRCSSNSTHKCATIGNGGDYCLLPEIGFCINYHILGETKCRHKTTHECEDASTNEDICIYRSWGKNLCSPLNRTMCVNPISKRCVNMENTNMLLCKDPDKNNTCREIDINRDIYMCRDSEGVCRNYSVDTLVCVNSRGGNICTNIIGEWGKCRKSDDVVCGELGGENCVDSSNNNICKPIEAGWCRHTLTGICVQTGVQTATGENYCFTAPDQKLCYLADHSMCIDHTNNQCILFGTKEADIGTGFCTSTTGGIYPHKCTQISTQGNLCRNEEDGKCVSISDINYCIRSSPINLCNQIFSDWCKNPESFCSYLHYMNDTKATCRAISNNNQCQDTSLVYGRSTKPTEITLGSCMGPIYNDWCVESNGKFAKFITAEELNLCRNPDNENKCLLIEDSLSTYCIWTDKECINMKSNQDYCLNIAINQSPLCIEMSTQTEYCVESLNNYNCSLIPTDHSICRDPKQKNTCVSVVLSNCYKEDNQCGDIADGFCKGSEGLCVQSKTSFRCPRAIDNLCQPIRDNKCININGVCTQILGEYCREKDNYGCMLLSGMQLCSTWEGGVPICTKNTMELVEEDPPGGEENNITLIYMKCHDMQSNSCKDLSTNTDLCNDKEAGGRCVLLASTKCRNKDNSCEDIVKGKARDAETGYCIDYGEDYCYDLSKPGSYIAFADNTHCRDTSPGAEYFYCILIEKSSLCRDMNNHNYCKKIGVNNNEIICAKPITNICEIVGESYCWKSNDITPYICDSLITNCVEGGQGKCTPLGENQCRNPVDRSCLNINSNICKKEDGECINTGNDYCSLDGVCQLYANNYCGITHCIPMTNNNLCRQSNDNSCLDLTDLDSECKHAEGHCLLTGMGLCQLKNSKLCSGTRVVGRHICTADHEHWLLLEGAVGSKFYGYISATAKPSQTESICPDIEQKKIDLWRKNTIQITQYADAKEEIEERQFTIYEASMEWRGEHRHGYLAQNTYAGCHVYLLYNDPTDFSRARMQRATYTIQREEDANGEIKTEYTALGRRVFDLPGVVDQESYIKQGLPCGGSTKYWYHPYTNHYFHLSAAATITLMDWGETSTSTACDIGYIYTEPIIYQIHINNILHTNYKYAVDHFLFVREHAYFQMVDMDNNYIIIKWSYTRSNIAIPHKLSVVYNTGNSLLTSFTALKNFGLVYTQLNKLGYYMLELRGKPAYDQQEIGDRVLSDDNPKLCYNETSWKLYQRRIDESKQATVYGIKKSEKYKIYTITTILREIYPKNSRRIIPEQELLKSNFYDNPTDFGVAHVMSLESIGCLNNVENPLVSGYSAIFININDLQFHRTCIPEITADSRGNGYLDDIEECDDGDMNKIGDNLAGCNKRGEVTLNYLTKNLITRSFLTKNLCGDGYYNPTSPEYEICDDGGESDYYLSNSGKQLGKFDGCSQDCVQPTISGYFCGTPGKPCEKLCGNGKIDTRNKGKVYTSNYPEELCDEGPYQQNSPRCVGCYFIHPGYTCPISGEKCVEKCGNGEYDGIVEEWRVDIIGAKFIYYPGESCDEGLNKSADFYSTPNWDWVTPPSIRDDLKLGGCDNCVIKSDSLWRCPEYGKACIYDPLCGDNINNDTYEDCDYQFRHLDSRCNATTCLFKYDFTCKTRCPGSWHWYTFGPFPCCISYYNNILEGHSDSFSLHAPDYQYWRHVNKHMVCFYGEKYCFDCHSIKWPGYPLNDYKDRYKQMLRDHEYYYIPKGTRGLILGLEYTTKDPITNTENVAKFGFSVLTDYISYQWSNINPSDPYNNIAYNGQKGVVRGSFGEYFFMSTLNSSNGYPGVLAQSIEVSENGDYTLETRFQTKNEYSSINANSFFIYWVKYGLFMTRQTDGINWQVFKLDINSNSYNTETEKAAEFETQLVYYLDIRGELEFDPVFRDEYMYLHRRVTNFNNESSCYISKYKYYSLGIILMEREWDIVCGILVSIVGFPEVIIWVTKDSNNDYKFYKENKVYPIPSPDSPIQITELKLHIPTQGEVISRDMEDGEKNGWILLQARSSPRYPNNSPIRGINPILGEHRNRLYNVGLAYSPRNQSSDINEILNIDPSREEKSLHFYVVVDLPSSPLLTPNHPKPPISTWDGATIPSRTGRFALDSDAPYTVTRNLFLALGTHKCSGKYYYDWEIVDDISLNVFNFITNTYSCYDFLIPNQLLDPDNNNIMTDARCHAIDKVF